MDCPIASDVRVRTGSIPRALLTCENFSCAHGLTSGTLYSSAFRPTISAVFCRPTGLLCCHSSRIIRIFPRSSRAIVLKMRSAAVCHTSLPAAYCRGTDAGWSSPVARKAHNLEVAGSNPAPATNIMRRLSSMRRFCRDEKYTNSNDR